MEDRPRRDRGLVSAPAAHHEASCGCPAAAGLALGATEPGRPPQLSQVGAARIFCGEALLELGESPHIVLHGVTPLRLGRTGVQYINFLRANYTSKVLIVKHARRFRVPGDIYADTDLTIAMSSRSCVPSLRCGPTAYVTVWIYSE